jgi:UDP:flavonoid glycosyltransferase YjiC (YdhE family)
MRILFTACPMYGHVNTMLPLARAARRAGHDVAVATGADLAGHVARNGLVAWPVGPTHDEAGGGADADWMAYFATSAHKRAQDLVPLADRWRPDLVITDETELAGPVVAAVTGARHVVHGLGIMPPMRIWDAFSAMMRGLYETWSLPDTVAAIRDVPYLEICPPSLRAPDERIWAHTVAIRPAMGEPVPGDTLPAGLDALPHTDTVHLTLGTVFHGNRDVLRTALAGLRDLPVNVVVAVGPGVDPDGLGPAPAHVVVAPYLPHALLLPRCRLVVSQGGAGVMFGALTHGLPQLVLPQGAEQFLNAEASQRAGASLTLNPDEVSAPAVAAAVARLLGEPSFTAAARVVRTEIEAMPTADAALAALAD